MNKKEAIKEIKKLEGLTILDKTINLDSEMIPKKEVFNIINQLDEPGKPVVPQFVADWYEDNKDDFEYSLYKLCTDFNEHKLREDLHKWFDDNNNKSIETLVLMHKFGYEVEKEKLYIVEIPNPHSYIDNHSRLARNYKGKVVLEVQDWLNTFESYKLTESEIKEDFEWAWQFAKEVEE